MSVEASFVSLDPVVPSLADVAAAVSLAVGDACEVRVDGIALPGVGFAEASLVTRGGGDEWSFLGAQLAEFLDPEDERSSLVGRAQWAIRCRRLREPTLTLLRIAQQRWGGFFYRDDCDDLFIDVDELADRWNPDPAARPRVVTYLSEQARRFPSLQSGDWLRAPDPPTARDQARRAGELLAAALRIVSLGDGGRAASAAPLDLSSTDSQHLRILLHSARDVLAEVVAMFEDSDVRP